MSLYEKLTVFENENLDRMLEIKALHTYIDKINNLVT